MPEFLQQREVLLGGLLSLMMFGTVVMNVSDRGVREGVTGGTLSKDSSMDFAELEFEYHPADWLSHCHWTQNTPLGVQCLVLFSFLRVLLRLKCLLSNVGVLAPGRWARHCAYVPSVGRNGAMQATKKRQSVQQDERSKQGCPTLTLKRGCICQDWFIQPLSRSEGGT